MYLDNLDEFINDEHRIVTYRWLSLTLNVASNSAKQMLYHYYEKHKESSDKQPLYLTYLLSGIMFDESLKQNVHKVCIVRGEDLERKKNEFKQLFSLHIYSIQKSRLKDLHLLYGAEQDRIRENVSTSAKFSSIFCASAGLRSKPEPPSNQTTNLNETKELKVSQASPVNDDENLENKENKPGEGNLKPKPQSKPRPKSALVSMLANMSKKSAEMEKKPGKKLHFTHHSGAGPKSGGISAYFTKGPSVKQEISAPVIKEEKIPIKEEEEEEQIAAIKEEEEELTVNVEVEENIKEEKKTEWKPKKKKYTKSQARTKKANDGGKRKSTSNSSPTTKDSKRRRILTLELSSESSEEEENLFHECPMPSPPPVDKASFSSDDEVVPPSPEPSPNEVGTKGKRRRRKNVDKTFMDENNFLVTRKMVEMVTDSEEDPIPKSPTKQESPNIPLRRSPSKSPLKSTKESPRKSPRRSKKSHKKQTKKSPAKTKQSEITNFFHRK